MHIDEKVEECSCTKENDEPCPEGKVKNADGVCVDKPAAEKKSKENDGEEPAGCEPGFHKDEDGNCVKDDAAESINSQILKRLEVIQSDYSNFKGQLEELKKLETTSGVRKPKPTATVPDAAQERFSLSKAIEKVARWIEGDRDGSCTVTIPVSELRAINTKQVRTPHGIMETFRSPYETELKVKEALGYTGTQSGQTPDLDVLLEPGGFSFLPVTQFARFKDITGTGTDRARFFKHDLPAPASQTAGTTATVGTMDIEAVEVTPSTITGVHLEIDTDDIENNPYDTVGTVVKASAARFDDFIGTDMLDTVSAEGTLTPLAWLKASDGTVITTSDAASVSMDSLGIAAGVTKLRNQGLLRGGVKPICIMHPDQYNDLVTDTGITNYTQFAKPEITTSGLLPELYGCQLAVSNAVQINSAQTNTAQNAVMFVPQHSYGIASARNVTVKFHEIPEDNQIWATTNWRIKSGVIDANSIIRLSSTQ